MKRRYLTLLLLLLTTALPMSAQGLNKDLNPVVDYGRTPRDYILKDITVSGAPNYDDYLLIGLSGLQTGQKITIPGDQITKAVRRYWRQGLFGNVAIRLDSVVHDSAYLHIQLTPHPRISEIKYSGVKKSEREDLEKKLGLIAENQITPNTIPRAVTLGKKYFD